jgi:hypothetical protein
MIYTGVITIILILTNCINVTSVYYKLLYYLLRLNNIVSCIIFDSEPLFIDLLICFDFVSYFLK